MSGIHPSVDLSSPAPVAGDTPVDADGRLVTRVWYTFFDSEVGPVWCARTDRGICRLEFGVDDRGGEEAFLKTLAREYHDTPRRDDEVVREINKDVRNYLNGRVPAWYYDLDLRAQRTLRKLAWASMRKVSYAETRPARDLADDLGGPDARRTVRRDAAKRLTLVGEAEAANPLPLIIPSHRVDDTPGLVVPDQRTVPQDIREHFREIERARGPWRPIAL